MILLQHISYIHPDKELLFTDINLTVNNFDKIALTGNNGSGKSTLLQIIAGKAAPAGGTCYTAATPYFVPQLFGQYNHCTIAQALGVASKLMALKAILAGDTTTAHFDALADDWTIEDRCAAALRYWGLESLSWESPLAALSGGQKTKVFLAGIMIHEPALILMDEPSNHLDMSSREQLYQFIQSVKSTLVVVSHDRRLLNLVTTIAELSKNGIRVYGGNYDFYKEQKQVEQQALSQEIQNRETALRKAREKEREAIERQQKLDSRGKAKQEKAGVAKIMMNTLRNNAEQSTAKMKQVHAAKTGGIQDDLKELRAALPDIDKMKFGFDQSTLHRGKVLFTATNVNFGYGETLLWKEALTVDITSGERVVLKGGNGAGKTTLVKIILGALEPTVGTVFKAANRIVYIDQDYSLLNPELSVYGQAQQFNHTGLQQHEVKIWLNRFLFTKDDWDKPCRALSGGERMRLILCCLTINSLAPDMIVLDEPTNNLDIQNIEILTAAINDYSGTLIVISHDQSFLEQLHINKEIELT